MIILICLLTSCKTSQLGIGLSQDNGNLIRGGETKSGQGLYLEYRWQKKIKAQHALGVDFNIHSAGYGAVQGDSEALIYPTLQGKYYYILTKPDSDIRMDVAMGLGLGQTNGNMLALYNLGLDFHFPRNNLIYIASRINSLSDLDDGTSGWSYTIGIGIKIR